MKSGHSYRTPPPVQSWNSDSPLLPLELYQPLPALNGRVGVNPPDGVDLYLSTGIDVHHRPAAIRAHGRVSARAAAATMSMSAASNTPTGKQEGERHATETLV